MKTVTVMIIMGRERDRWGYPGRYGEEEEGEGEEEEGLVWEYSSSWIQRDSSTVDMCSLQLLSERQGNRWRKKM